MFVDMFCAELMFLGLICTTVGSVFMGLWSLFCFRIHKESPEILCGTKKCEYLDRIAKPGLLLFLAGSLLQCWAGYLTL
jgi:hypothetical protein